MGPPPSRAPSAPPVRRIYALRLELDELDRAHERLGYALGYDRAAVVLSEERARFQQQSGRCAICRVILDDHPAEP